MSQARIESELRGALLGCGPSVALAGSELRGGVVLEACARFGFRASQDRLLRRRLTSRGL